MIFVNQRSQRLAFTMVEIAFSLAIVAFALVAIMGVLPTGMTVQKDNREDTVINQDAMFWLESMRSGSHGIDDLTNYVETIIISNRVKVAVYNNSFDPKTDIRSGEQIVGLLSTPKLQTNGTEVLTNLVIARVRAINGPAVEKGNPTNDFAFRYELNCELTPSITTPPNADSIYGDLPGGVTKGSLETYTTTAGRFYDQNIMANLSNLRLTFRWPLFQQGTNWGVGRNLRTMRGLVNGRVNPLVLTNGTIQTNFFIEPNVYAYVVPPP